jgi:predicted dehydrogenase
LIHCAFTFPVKPDSSNLRLFAPEMGGGSLWDVGCYGVSLARWLLEEEPVAASGQAMYAETGVDLSFVGTLRFPGGAMAVVESGFTAALQQTYSVIGEEGAVELPHDAFIPWEHEARFTLREADQEAGKSVGIPGADEYQLMVEHFSGAVLGEAELAYPPEDSVRGMRALDALARSARAGKSMDLPAQS